MEATWILTLLAHEISKIFYNKIKIITFFLNEIYKRTVLLLVTLLILTIKVLCYYCSYLEWNWLLSLGSMHFGCALGIFINVALISDQTEDQPSSNITNVYPI